MKLPQRQLLNINLDVQFKLCPSQQQLYAYIHKKYFSSHDVKAYNSSSY